MTPRRSAAPLQPTPCQTASKRASVVFYQFLCQLCDGFSAGESATFAKGELQRGNNNDSPDTELATPDHAAESVDDDRFASLQRFDHSACLSCRNLSTRCTSCWGCSA